jgi:hypothetical protein
MSIIDIQKPTKQSIPRPSREQLIEVAEQVWRYSDEHAHDLEKGTTTDKFFSACIRVTTSNLKAMLKLSSSYLPESGSVFRNLVETCIDFFWVSSYLESEPSTGQRLAENFFLFGKAKFVENAPLYASIGKTDQFLRDVPAPFNDVTLIDTCEKELAGRSFGDSWRFDPAIFTDEKETKWRMRSQRAAEFAARVVNLKGAPYLANLRTLSSYSHFDPAQVSYFSKELVNRFFDRSINIAIGFVFDMIIYSHKRKNWTPPQTLVLLQHKFIWFST